MYLIVKCGELSDAWECDANRTPICMTDDYSSYGLGYEVYKVLADNTFKKIKDYEEGLEEGFAIYYWDNCGEDMDEPPHICEKFKDFSRNGITKSFIKKIKSKYLFHGTVEEIYESIQSGGSYGEVVNDTWLVIGEYMDSHFDSGC